MLHLAVSGRGRSLRSQDLLPRNHLVEIERRTVLGGQLSGHIQMLARCLSIPAELSDFSETSMTAARLHRTTFPFAPLEAAPVVLLGLIDEVES